MKILKQKKNIQMRCYIKTRYMIPIELKVKLKINNINAIY